MTTTEEVGTKTKKREVGMDSWGSNKLLKQDALRNRIQKEVPGLGEVDLDRRHMRLQLVEWDHTDGANQGEPFVDVNAFLIDAQVIELCRRIAAAIRDVQKMTGEPDFPDGTRVQVGTDMDAPKGTVVGISEHGVLIRPDDDEVCSPEDRLTDWIICANQADLRKVNEKPTRASRTDQEPSSPILAARRMLRPGMIVYTHGTKAGVIEIRENGILWQSLEKNPEERTGFSEWDEDIWIVAAPTEAEAERIESNEVANAK